MHIGKPSIVERGGSVALSAMLTAKGHSQEVWFAVARDCARYLDPACLDPFVVGALPLALRTGDSIYANGRMSARLLFALNTAVPALAAQAGNGLQQIKVRAAQAVDYAPPPPHSRAVATGFSGGVDSFCVLADHLGPAVPPAHRLTHLVFNNVGAFGPRGAAAFVGQLPHLVECAREFHLPVIAIDSNLDELHHHEHFAHDHQFRNTAAVLALQPLIGTFLYAAGFRYEDCFTRGNDSSLAKWDPVLLPQLSTERLRVLSVGAQYSRLQRTERITAIPQTRRHLHVCVRGADHRNCSTCWKCVRTLLSLELLGLLAEYREVFDLQAYSAVRSRFIVGMLRSAEPHWAEIRTFARERGFRFPASLRLAAALPPRVLEAARRHLPHQLKQRLVPPS